MLSNRKAGKRWTVKINMRIRSAEPRSTNIDDIHLTAGMIYFWNAVPKPSDNSYLALKNKFFLKMYVRSLGPY